MNMKSLLVMRLVVGIALAMSTCPPVQEGKSCSIQCSNPIYSDKLVWLLTSDSEEIWKFEVPCLEQNNRTCTVPKYSLEVTNNMDDSTLKFNKVTKEHRNWRVECVAVNSKTGSNTTVSNCKVEVFFKPEAPTCRAEKKGANRILVTCLTRKVYPGLKCQLTQRETKTAKITNILSGIEYKNEPQSNGYSASSCSVLIQYLPPGNYQYFAVLTPDISTYVRNYSVPVDATIPIDISGISQEVEVFLESTDCPEEASGVILVCEARGFTSMTSINLFLGDRPIKELDFSVQRGLNKPVCRSRFIVPADTEGSVTILCVANTTDNTVTNQTTMQAAFSGYNANIMLSSHSGKLVTYNKRCHLHLSAETSSLQFACSLENARDLTIAAVCVKEEQTLLNTSLNVSSVNVNINNRGDYDGAECQCIARHVDGWIRQKTFFRIRVVSDYVSFSLVNIGVPIILGATVILCITIYILLKIGLRKKSNYSKVGLDDHTKIHSEQEKKMKYNL